MFDSRRRRVLRIVAALPAVLPGIAHAATGGAPDHRRLRLAHLHTGERVPEVWERWLEFDPLHACERYAEGLARLELLHLECGVMDEYDLQFGLRKLVRRLTALGVVLSDGAGTSAGGR